MCVLLEAAGPAVYAAADQSLAMLPAELPMLAKVESLEAELLKMEQVHCPLEHRFAPGVYLREIFMPKGAFVIGHEHRTEHFNIVLRGKAVVMMEGQIHKIAAPSTFVSRPGVRKVLYIEEDCVWQTVHPTEETDLLKLERLLINHSATYIQHAADLEQLKLALQTA
jgi:quercetin dioxygenase-like cupin family protein